MPISLGIGTAVTRGGGLYGPSPQLDLNFASLLSLTPSVGPTPSFTRASTGTYFNSSGVLTTAAINGPRFDHVYNGVSWVSKGLLIEEARTNTATYSEQFDNAAWTKSGGSISANQIAAPDGATTADKFTEDSGSSAHHCLGSGGSIANNTICTASCFVKKGDRRYVCLTLNDGTATRLRYTVIFDLDTGTQVNEFSIGSPTDTGYFIQNFSNGWYKISVKIKTGSSQAYACEIAIGMSDSASPSTRDFTNPSYAGNGSSNFYLWGDQVEVGAFPTSYIPTTTAAVTRSADVCQITGGDFSGFWNQPAGALAVEGDTPTSGTRSLVSADNATANESTILRTLATDPLFIVTDGGVAQASIDAGTVVSSTAFKLAASYTVNDFAVSNDGAAVVTDTSGTIPTPTQLNIGSDASGNYVCGHIARLRYFNTRLLNSQLVELST